MQEIFRSQFRLPVELADKIRESADASGRSMNAEVVARLEQSFQERAGQSLDAAKEEVRAQIRLVLEEMKAMENVFSDARRS
ncbi:Arc family DNA-binding protein [Delftia acidovorans]|uniref:Arc family DNA-binding protein n=1 Tax=Delftia acidovorans TaxID=80866 RepID=UPI0000E8FA52|nr:Arc family DNA-binding protein [Delftia acidovorans]QPS74825.1 Arc family DNA-binding protein [Delftia acidovorans]